MHRLIIYKSLPNRKVGEIERKYKIQKINKKKLNNEI